MAACHNTPALPAPSRRSFMGQVAVAAASLTAIAATSDASAANFANPDARLIAMQAQWQALQMRCDSLDCRMDETYSAASDTTPIPPEIRSSEPDPVGGKYLPLTRSHLKQWVKVGENGFPNIIEARRRLALLDDYEAELEAELVRNGHIAIETERARILAEQRQLEAEMQSTPAAGLAGIAVKLFILYQTGPFGFDLNGDADPETMMLFATIQDAERLAGLPQSLPPVRSTTEA